MKEIPTLNTDRLILRPFSDDDAAEVKRLGSAFEIADNTAMLAYPYEDGMAERWIAKHKKQFKQGTRLDLAITLRSDQSLLGAISLMNIQHLHQAELGYWIGLPYWNQGFASEATRAVLHFGFSSMQLIRIHASCLKRNPTSIQVLQKVGFRLEGTREQHIRKWDKFEDIVLFGAMADQWQG